MLVVTRSVGESLLIEDVQLTVIQMQENTITFSMQKLTGGRETIVHLQRHQIVEVCYNVKFQLVRVAGSRARLGLEVPPGVNVQRLEGNGN